MLAAPVTEKYHADLDVHYSSLYMLQQQNYSTIQTTTSTQFNSASSQPILWPQPQDQQAAWRLLSFLTTPNFLVTYPSRLMLWEVGKQQSFSAAQLFLSTLGILPQHEVR